MIKFKKLLTSVVLLSISLVFAIGLIFTAEILWRAFGPVATRGQLIDIALFPYKHYVVTTHPPGLTLGKTNNILEGYFSKNACLGPGGTTAKFNREGYRTHEFDNVPPKEPGEIRIIITGGSASISWNINEACTLDSNLYRLFAKYYPNKKVKIFNLGNGAWKSFQQLIALQLHGLKLEPDLIIAFDGFNDIQHSYSMPIEQPYNNNAETAFKRYKAWTEGRVSELFKSLKIIQAIKHPGALAVGMVGRTKQTLEGGSPEYAKEAKPGKLGTQMHYPLDLGAITKRTDFDPYNQEVVKFYLQNERLMAKAASTVGSKMIIALQPILYVKTPLSEDEKKILDSYAHSVNFVVQGYERMKKGLKIIEAEEKNVTFYDMSNIFENDHTFYFADYCHFNTQGYEIVANKLFGEIEKTLQLK